MTAVGWLIMAIGFLGYLAFIWRLLGDQDDEAVQEPVFVPDPDATVMLAPVPSWYQLNYEGRATQRLLDRAALLLDG